MRPVLLNPARLDFVTLRLFCAVAESGSISKGALACQLALSAASRRLSDFEHTAGLTLLQRTSRGVTLTEAGHAVLVHARTLFHGFEKLSQDVAQYRQGLRGQVRVWANMSALTEFLPDALAEFMRRCPEVQVDVEEQARDRIVAAVKEGTADIGIISGLVEDAALALAPLHSDELVLVCARQHPLARRRRLAFAETLEFEQIGLSQGTSLADLTAAAAQRAGRPLRLRMQARSFDASCQMIAATQGLGVLPRLGCRAQIRSLGLRAIPLSDAWAQRQFFAATRADTPLAPAAHLLHDYLTSTALER